MISILDSIILPYAKTWFIPTISALGKTMSTDMYTQYSLVVIESPRRPTQLAYGFS